MSLTLSTILYPYWAFLAIFAVGVLIDVWHIVKFGTYGGRNVLALALFLAGAAAILWLTAQLLAGVEWSTPLVENVVATFPSFAP